ncbi:MAG TPA: hypothetical protein VN673_15500 [Clostridia bacterium]|nr:hypothetical protein [Clostridia bacterium]
MARAEVCSPSGDPPVIFQGQIMVVRGGDLSNPVEAFAVEHDNTAIARR